MLLRKRTKQYLEYFEAETWQDQTDKPFPKIILLHQIKSHIIICILSLNVA